ncbi:DUF262 domain-containing protein [Microvirga massiliensis]|uniref:DUF262 domain-containing protein n=1 Tax=Microvirga massiliensis TaxID=1033741 RepID=UPI00062B3EA8|nr:DUF262 domain-containing protein [Microvirga massiliensis]
MVDSPNGPEFVEEQDTSLDQAEVLSFSQAVLYSTDWTVETVVSQLERGNIDMSPRFQRRDAWGVRGKGRFIESIILGLPIPPIVLAEKKNQRGRYIVLDGKQRLLSLLQFTGKAEGENNAFGLSGLEARPDLTRKKFTQLESDPALRGDLDAFLNHTIRTVVIRNWPSTDFLHLVFLRLNTGSVRLSPQELRQAMVPGEFSNLVDDAAADSIELQTLLSRASPDPRMRDVELLVRFLAIRNFLNSYAGRMKSFLDLACETLNAEWARREGAIKQQIGQFGAAVRSLIAIFEEDKLARKPGSRSFNRAIFDALVFYGSDDQIRIAMEQKADDVVAAYGRVVQDPVFMEAVESDTAGIPHTFERLAIWGAALREATGLQFRLPEMVEGRIRFTGFWQ